MACVIYYRRQLFRSAKNLLFIGVAPLLGAIGLFWAFGKSAVDLADPANSESGDSWFGLGPPLVIGVGLLLLGIPLMIAWWVLRPGSSGAGPRSRPRRARPSRSWRRSPTSGGRKFSRAGVGVAQA